MRTFTLDELAAEHKTWEAHNFPVEGQIPEIGVLRGIVGMCEELGELAHSVLKMYQGIRGDEAHIDRAKDAVGDLIVYATGVTDKLGFTIQESVDRAWNEVRDRDWIKYPGDGMTH